MRQHRFASVLVLASCFSPSIAGAQISDFDRNTARTLGQEGHAALDQNDFAAAADRFARADALVHAPTFLLGLAQAQVGLGKLVSAMETYSRILREGLPASPPAPFARAIEVARREADALAARIPHVIVQVEGRGAAGARVTIDGQVVPPAALGVKRAIDPGEHVVRAESQGLAASEKTVTVAEGEVETVTLEPAPAAPPAQAAGRGSEAAAGRGSTRRALGVAGIAAGGVGITLGAVTGGVAIAEHGSLLRSCPGGKCPIGQEAELRPRIGTYETFAGISTAGVVAGGVLAAAGIALVVTATGAEGRRGGAGITIEPIAGAGWAGVRGRF
jgi:hypothetical protein